MAFDGLQDVRRERDLSTALGALGILLDAALGVDLHHEQARAALVDAVAVEAGEFSPAQSGVEAEQAHRPPRGGKFVQDALSLVKREPLRRLDRDLGQVDAAARGHRQDIVVDGRAHHRGGQVVGPLDRSGPRPLLDQGPDPALDVHAGDGPHLPVRPVGHDVVLDVGGISSQGVGLDDSGVPPPVVPLAERHLTGPRVAHASAGELGLHLDAPGARLRLEGERLAEPVSDPVAYGRLPFAGLQLADVRGTTPCSTMTRPG